MEFHQFVNGRELPDMLRLEGEFYEADIKVDAILSFPWLLSNHIGIFPHLGALAKDEPQFTLLYAVRKVKKARKRSRKGRGAAAGVMHVGTGVGYISDGDGKAGEINRLRLGIDEGEVWPNVLGLEDEELDIVKGCIGRVEDCTIRALEVSDEVCEKGDRVEALREEIYAQFRDTAFRDELYKNPPCRGTFGYAYIPLKEGAAPTRQKPFVMHGERREAYEHITR
jgi:hypothetical protein